VKIGDRLQGYEILGVVGVGAMGQVFRARDSRLGREVAIKVLPADVTASPRRRLRFEREARTLAALNHPNIATLHEAGHAPDGGITFLVMELVAGEDLSARLARGRVPLSEALAIARQLASALAAAHDAGVVHRDLKPGNIKLRRDDTVKVIDFGLALRTEVIEELAAPSGERVDAALMDDGQPPRPTADTVTMGADRTADGAILGSAAYMSPEQARGEPVDRRTDIWAFGVVLFEMIAGRRPFDAPDTAGTIAQVLSQEPPWTALPGDTPVPIRRVLARCLAKDRRQRLHDISDARLEVDEALTPALPPDARDVPHKRRRTRVLWLLTSAVLGVAAGAALWGERAPAARVIHAQLRVTPAERLDAGGKHPSVVLPAAGARTALEWSPDGRTLAFIGVQAGVRRVYLRDLSSAEARPVAGTEGAGAFAFSPDGESVAFWADGAIKRVAVRGGPVVELSRHVDLYGLAWGRSRIVVAGGSLSSFSMSGAREMESLTTVSRLVRHGTPFLLPDESAVLFTEYSRQWTAGDERVMVLPLSAGASPRVLIPDAADARYLSSGHLAFLRRGTLFVVAFDAPTLQVRGEPVALVTNVSQAVEAWDSWDLTLAGQFAVSRDGSLAYVSAPLPEYPAHELVAADRAGRIARIASPARAYRSRLAMAPDGGRVGVSVQTQNGLQLHTVDLARGTLTRIAESLPGEPILTDWSRTGELAVGLVDGGTISSAIVRPDAGSAIRSIPDSDGFWPASLSATGRLASMGDSDIWIFATDGSGRREPLARTRGTETQPVWSPDGRWIAYTSDLSGHLEVYLRPYPGPGEAVMISVAGGSSPAWHANGRELFYVESDPAEDRMMSVAVDAAGRAEVPRRLFATPRDTFFRSATVFTPYAVTPDGARFLAVRQIPRRDASVTELHVVLNWMEDVRARLGR
jgi:serine/threonine-protein kinase